MIDVWNQVYTYVKKSLEKDYASCSFGTSNSGSPTRFPYFALIQTGNNPVNNDMELNENAVNSVIEINTYSDKNQIEARKVISSACDLMAQLGYRRTTGPYPINNANDTKVYRMFARFSRIVGSGEEII